MGKQSGKGVWNGFFSALQSLAAVNSHCFYRHTVQCRPPLPCLHTALPHCGAVQRYSGFYAIRI